MLFILNSSLFRIDMSIFESDWIMALQEKITEEELKEIPEYELFEAVLTIGNTEIKTWVC